jgi:hypothetical protein
MNDLGQIAQLITALVLAFNCLQTWRNGQRALSISKGINDIKIATDGMKDALVASTAKASFQEGTAAGLEQGRTEQPLKVDIVKLPEA